MKSADVAVALLNGFGDEKNDLAVDFDDELRRKKAENLAIGNQRQASRSFRKGSKIASERVAAKMEKAQTEIRERAAARQGVRPDSDEVKFEMQDLKDMFAANFAIMKEERQRAASLRVGGGDAARILAAERREKETDEDLELVDSIKPGEASLVAPFSCLHPSIEGVNSVLRAGVATAASALATQELIALHSLMACFSLASLYRDGFRYGKHMSLVEITMYMLVEQQRHRASCIPRPRLPRSTRLRPPQSMFQPAAIFRTVGQAAIHLILMSVGVSYARRLEHLSSPGDKFRLSVDGSRPKTISKMLSALALSGTGMSQSDDAAGHDKAEGLFRRPPFRPNYNTNIVFILSILQNMLVSVANHKGKPFNRSILESRSLCNTALLTGGLCVALIVELFPKINAVLQLRPMPSRKSQGIFLLIAFLNVGASTFVSRLFTSTGPAMEEMDKSVARAENGQEGAADLEERLLREESSLNVRTTLVALALLAYLVFQAVVKS